MHLEPSEADALREQFLALLDGAHEEQKYQSFIEAHPQFVPREFLQNHGMNLNFVLRKLSLARDFTSDFFYLAKSSADWHCVLVEIEKPQSQYFRTSSNEFHPDFVAALSQINRWRAWFDNRANFDGFVNGTIRPLRVPASMTSNPCFIKYVLVHGRRSEYERNEHRAALIRVQERDDFHILSFDSLAEDLQNKADAYIGVRKNDRFEVITSHYVDDKLFVWMDTSYLRVSQRLKADIEAKRSKWFTFSSKGVKAMEAILPTLVVADV